MPPARPDHPGAIHQDAGGGLPGQALLDAGSVLADLGHDGEGAGKFFIGEPDALQIAGPVHFHIVLYESSFQSENVGSFVAGGVGAQQVVHLGGVGVAVGGIDLEFDLQFGMLRQIILFMTTAYRNFLPLKSYTLKP